MIEFRDVHKELGGQPVLRGLSLRVAPGETYVIVGPSGTGKSVTLKHIVGLLRPDSGCVLVEGEDVHSARPARLKQIRGKFGFLFQSGALINWMTVFDNVALPLREHGNEDYATIRRKVSEQLAVVGLEGIEERMPAELSGGMRKRVGLARAIIRGPSIVLYDEPTSGLDPVMSRAIDRLIRELRQRLHVTSIVVTHDLRSAFEVGDKVAMLLNGRIVEQGTPDDFAASEQEAVREFIDSQFGGQYTRSRGAWAAGDG